MGAKVESKSQSSAFPNFALDVLISYFNMMNSFTYDSSHSSPSKCFALNNDENEETVLKDLIKVVEIYKNQTFILEDTIIINLGTTEEP